MSEKSVDLKNIFKSFGIEVSLEEIKNVLVVGKGGGPPPLKMFLLLTTHSKWRYLISHYQNFFDRSGLQEKWRDVPSWFVQGLEIEIKRDDSGLRIRTLKGIKQLDGLFEKGEEEIKSQFTEQEWTNFLLKKSFSEKEATKYGKKILIGKFHQFEQDVELTNFSEQFVREISYGLFGDEG